MQEKFKELIALAKDLASKANSTKTLNEVKINFLGKSGEITQLMKGMRDVPKDERAELGKLVNECRENIEKIFDEKETSLKALEQELRFKNEAIDISLPSKKNQQGNLNPLTIVRNQILETFLGLGFEVFEGPEIETDYYCFQALNLPKDHPARDMQDTFYISENILLRPHTSPGQIRIMEGKKPPLRFLSPGRVYRADDDATHSPMFNQVEGFAVDKNLTLCDLKGVLDSFAKKLFDENTKTRLRPSYFPFTEPSVEVDVTCSECHGKGCRLCKGTGWIEILGAGMINKHVLENCGIDSSVYSGFAFGCGVERIAMIKYGIPDMRLLFENDVRFLKQFK